MDERIFINGRFLTQPLTGVQRYGLEIVNALAEVRDDLTVLVPRAKLLARPTSAAMGTVGRLVGHPWEQLELPMYLRSQGYPTLVNLCNTAPVAYHRKISTLHDICFIRCPGSYSMAFRALYRLEIPLVLRTSRAIATVSEFSRTEISSYYEVDPRRISVVPDVANGIFFENGERVANAGIRYFLAVGSWAAHKNFEALLNAFKLVRSWHSDARLVLVGETARIFVGSGANGSQEPGVVLVGRVDLGTLATLYRGAVALVFPSRYEGFGLPPLEAQASGCPVIASQSSAMPEVLGESALLVNPESVVDLAAAMGRVWTDSRLRSELVERGLRNVRRYPAERSAHILSDLIDSLPAR